MERLFKVLFCAIVVDFFFFSSPFVFTGPLNTKEILAAVGLVIIVFDWMKKKRSFISRELIGLLAGSGFVSLMALFSTMYHNSQDPYYNTYFLSMLVWLVAAYTAVRTIIWIHGKVSVKLLCQYLVFISCFQGILAVAADNYAPLSDLLITICPGVGWERSIDRLFGLGINSCLDTGGIRYAIASILCIHIIKINLDEGVSKGNPLYILVFCIICVCGNMIARTTVVGSAIGLAYLCWILLPRGGWLKFNDAKTLAWLVVIVTALFSIASFFYKTNDNFYYRMRFGFEGFFSLAETGHWHTASNEKLETMYVWPDNPETWLIGDGYFANPADDLNYYGVIYEGYYKGTDVGYLRFIYYFGLIGLGFFVGFIIYAGVVCMKMFPDSKMIMLLMTSMTFVIWFKVATDCFFILAMFICLGYSRDMIVTPNIESYEEESISE